jgi:hypothetical protein
MKLGSEMALQIDLAAAVIAVLALLFSIRAGMRQRRHERETLHLQRDSDIIAWSNACLAGLCQGEMLLRPEFAAIADESEFEKRRFEVLADISCCIDRGRMFFPNRDADRVGLDKEGAFRGYRHAVLDRLVWVYELLARVTYREPADAAERSKIREEAITHKRHFISEVQSEVDPRRRISFLEEHA